MSNDIFDVQILTEKLLKLNNSQQSIESLSRWCISHRKKAKDIVETWDNLFNSSQKEQRVSFLYLANDILQNSRRKGSEFVNEFWKVLPASLRHVYENGDEYGKKAVTRLVDIWEERKVFGSRGQGLKDEMMGKTPLPSPATASNGKSNPIKIVKRDANSVRIKLAVGGPPEKILTAFQSVLDEHLGEEAALSKCFAAVRDVGKLMEDVENTLAQGNQLGSTLMNDLQDQEKELKQYMLQLENAEAARDSLLSQLKDALLEQVSRQEVVRKQLLAARGQIERAVSIRKRLNPAAEDTRVLEQNAPSAQLNSTSTQPPFTQPFLSFAPLKATEEDNKKAAAAAVAAKLAASTSSAQMLTSILSSLVAEEAASMNGSSKSTGFTSGLPMFNPEKRPKLEKPLPDVSNSDAGGSSFLAPSSQLSMANMPLAPSINLQAMSQPSQLQSAFSPAPPPPPPPPPPPSHSPVNQYVQSSGLMIGGIPYGYGSNNLPPPPPPPLPPHVAAGLSRPGTQPLQQSQGQQAQQQQQSATGGFYRPPSIGFYGQSHPSTPPPVHRQ